MLIPIGSRLINTDHIVCVTEHQGSDDKPRWTVALSNGETFVTPCRLGDVTGTVVPSPLDALKGIPTGSPASAAYTTAIRRRGEELAAIGGSEALRAAHAAVLDAAPDHADARASVLKAAWLSVPGWSDYE